VKVSSKGNSKNNSLKAESICHDTKNDDQENTSGRLIQTKVILTPYRLTFFSAFDNAAFNPNDDLQNASCLTLPPKSDEESDTIVI